MEQVLPIKEESI